MAKRTGKSSRPPREGDEIYVGSTQIYGKVVEVGEQRGRRHGTPMYHVIYERHGTLREGLVFNLNGRTYMGAAIGVRGEKM